MKAPLIFSSSATNVNIQKIFKIVLSKAFELKCSIPREEKIGAAIIEFWSLLNPLRNKNK